MNEPFGNTAELERVRDRFLDEDNLSHRYGTIFLQLYDDFDSVVLREWIGQLSQLEGVSVTKGKLWGLVLCLL